MSDGFCFKANHASAPVTVEVRCGWAETATYEQVHDALVNAYTEAMKLAVAKLYRDDYRGAT